MALYAKPAGLLASHNDWFGFHERADVFKANRGFINLNPEHLRDGIDLVTGRNRPHDSTGPTPVLLQMIKSQGQDLIGRNPGAVLVDDAKPVGVSIQSQPQTRFSAADELAHLGHAFGVWLRMMPAEQGI